MNELDDFVGTAQFGCIHLACCLNENGTWHLTFYLFVPYKTEKSQGEMPAKPTAKLRSVLEDVVGQPVEFSERHTLECVVPEVGPDLLRKLKRAVSGEQKHFWKPDPEVVRGIEDDDNDPWLRKVRHALKNS